MSVNISKQKRDRLVEKINKIKTYIASAKQDENTAQLLTYIADIEKDIKGKKYGLVFEEHREAIDEILEQNTPVLTEEKDLFIDNGGNMNFLIEGDNLAALQLLEKTHKGKIDLIYIDPPYNKGEKDFVYDDDFVDKNDLFKHSKWVSFMSKRIRLAYEILSERGYIFISIDENEAATLTLIMNEVFGEDNYISHTFVLDNLKGKTGDNYITSVGSRLLVFAKNKNRASGFSEVENVFGDTVEKKYLERDDKGLYSSITFKKTGQSKYREDRPYMFYPILQKDGILYPIKEDEYSKLFDWKTKTFDDKYLSELKKQYADYEFILPQDISGKYLRWTNGYKNFCRKINEDIFYNNGVYQKDRPSTGELLAYYTLGRPKSFMYKPSYAMGTEDLKKVLPDVNFDFPKPIELIEDILRLLSENQYTILDFFAGSGTTGHAVMKLNAEDGGKRKFILCTNNENNICRDVTYERIKRVIARDKYEASLKYYKVDFVPISDKLYYEYADELLKHIRELVELENGINFNGNAKIAIVLTEKELDEFTTSIPDKCKTIYLGHDVLPSEEQDSLFKARGIAVNIIPDYYYRELEG